IPCEPGFYKSVYVKGKFGGGLSLKLGVQFKPGRWRPVHLYACRCFGRYLQSSRQFQSAFDAADHCTESDRRPDGQLDTCLGRYYELTLAGYVRILRFVRVEGDAQFNTFYRGRSDMRKRHNGALDSGLKPNALRTHRYSKDRDIKSEAEQVLFRHRLLWEYLDRRSDRQLAAEYDLVALVKRYPNRTLKPGSDLRCQLPATVQSEISCCAAGIGRLGWWRSICDRHHYFARHDALAVRYASLYGENAFVVFDIQLGVDDLNGRLCLPFGLQLILAIFRLFNGHLPLTALDARHFA